MHFPFLLPLFLLLTTLTLALALPQSRQIRPFATFTAHSFAEEQFACATVRTSTPVASLAAALAALSGSASGGVHCAPSAAGEERIAAGLVIVSAGAGGGEGERCFRVATAVDQLVARCAFDGRVGGRLTLPGGGVVVSV